MKLISAQNSAVEEWQKATRPSRTYAICEVYRCGITSTTPTAGLCAACGP